MAAPIRKAVFPVAGLGTRFLPATKAIPKEMLTVVDRPVIQHVAEEAWAAGITHLVFVTGRNKHAIEDHFDRQFELEETLRARGKTGEIELVESALPVAGETSFTRQQEPLGLGHAVWCAREIVGNEPFALVLPDMLAKGEPGCLAQMMAVYNRQGGNVIGVEAVPHEDVGSYGIVAVGEELDGAFRITGMVEKPAPEDAPSNLMIMGRYILQPEIFDILSAHERGAGGEIQVTDAMARMMASQDFAGVRFNGRTFDCGSKLGFLAANVAYGLEDGEIGAEFRAEAAELLGTGG